MAKAAQMHGTPRSARSLEDYESPEAYAGQGDDRIIRHRAFAFTVAIAEDNAGNPVLDGDTAYHGETVTIDQIGLVNLEKGERLHAFYTTEERRRLEAGGNPDRPDSVSSGGTTFSELGEWEMAEYINGENPQGKKLTVQETVDLAEGDKDVADRLLRAEHIATDGDPRDGVVKGLTAIIEEA